MVVHAVITADGDVLTDACRRLVDAECGGVVEDELGEFEVHDLLCDQLARKLLHLFVKSLGVVYSKFALLKDFRGACIVFIRLVRTKLGHRKLHDERVDGDVRSCGADVLKHRMPFRVVVKREDHLLARFRAANWASETRSRGNTPIAHASWQRGGLTDRRHRAQQCIGRRTRGVWRHTGRCSCLLLL